MLAKKVQHSSVLSELNRFGPTEVFDAYWYFASERQKIFELRRSSKPAPWTKDSILQMYKFTNAYRLLDRVSQYLIREVIGEGGNDKEDLFFRVVLFKLFNKIETWELINRELGYVSWKAYDYQTYERILSKAMSDGRKIYSAAYIMPSGLTSFGSKRKHRNHLRLLELMMKNQLPLKIADSRSMDEAYKLLSSYPTVGRFLSYQLATDLNYSDLTDFDEAEFVVSGPGACEGIRKCFSNLGDTEPEEIIRIVADQQEEEFVRRGLVFRGIAGRRLKYIDCQNLFCEIDKYSRVAFPAIQGRTGRTRIKQKFQPNCEPIQYMLPQKWGGRLDISKD